MNLGKHLKPFIFLLLVFQQIDSSAQSYKMLLPVFLNTEIMSTNFSPSGFRMVTASKDNYLRIWDLRTKKIIAEINTKQNELKEAFFSADGTKLLSISRYNFKCWDALKLNLLNTFEFNSYSYTNIGFSKDSKKILAKSDGSIHFIWQIGFDKAINILDKYRKANDFLPRTIGVDMNADRILFLRGGSLFLCSITDNKVIWVIENFPNTQTVAQFHIKSNLISAFTTTGEYFLLDGKDGNILYNTKTGVSNDFITEKNGIISNPMPSSYSLNSSETNITVSDSAGNLILLDIQGKIVSKKYALEKTKIAAVSIAEDGYVSYYNTKGAIKVINLKSNNIVYSDSLLRTWSLFGNTGDTTMDELTEFFKPVKEVDNVNEIIYIAKRGLFFWRGQKYNYFFSLNQKKIILKTPSGILGREGYLDITGGHFMLQSSFNKWSIYNLNNGQDFQITTNNQSHEISNIVFNQRKKDLFLLPKSGNIVFSTLNLNTSQILEHKIDSPKFNNRYYGKYSNKIILNTYDSSICYDFINNKILFRESNLSNVSIGGVFLAGITKSKILKLWNFIDDKFDRTVDLGKLDFKQLAVSPSMRYYSFLLRNEDIIQYDIITIKVVGTIKKENNGDITDIKYSDDSEILCIVNGDSINIYSTKDLKKINTLYIPGAFKCYISNENKFLAVGTLNNKIELLDFDTLSKKQIFNRSGSLEFFKDPIVNIEITRNNNYLLAEYYDGSYCIWRIKDGKMVTQIESVANHFFLPTINSCAFILKNNTVALFDFANEKIIANIYIENSERYIIQLPEGFYKSSPSLTRDISYFDKKLNTISFDQLDIKYNRPDKVLEAIGSTDTALIESYRNAYYKRIKKLGIDTTSFKEGFTIPEADFKNRDAIEYEQITKQLKLQITGKSTENLDRFNIWVNEVPLYGQKGINLRYKSKNNIDTTLSITLSEGDNNIETSITDVNGIESYHQPLIVKYIPEKKQSAKTYFIGIGINRFADSSNNLSWSVKDIRDLATKFGSKNAVIDTLFDENVTKENIVALKNKLLTTNEEDKVIIAYSGHGLLSKEYDYYLSTYPVNFTQPEQSGLPYDELENLLNGIKARKKLMLIDACHSGEVDKDEMKNYTVGKDSLDIQGVKGIILETTGENKIGMKNSFEVMQELFVNVGRGTGATIISAAAGTQFALERGDLKNGVFTYCLLEAMNSNSTIKISDLKKVVTEKVPLLTGGLQKPTFRAETQQFDWELW